jgi:plastocyanin
MLKRLIAAAALFALVAGGCGDDGSVTVKDGGEVVIDLSEYAFSPSEIHVTAGSTVTFVIRNTGATAHEFMIGRTPRTVDGNLDGFEVDFFHDLDPVVVPADAEMVMDEMDMGDDMSGDDMSGDMGDDMSGDMGDDMSGEDMGDDMGEDMHMDHGFMILRSPDEEARLTITIPSDATGEWMIGCFREDGAHWTKGMQATLIVDEA